VRLKADGQPLNVPHGSKKTRVMKIIEYKKTDADYSGSWTQIFGDTASQLYTRVY